MWLYWFVQLFVTKVGELKDHSAPSKIRTQQTLRQPSRARAPMCIRCQYKLNPSPYLAQQLLDGLVVALRSAPLPNGVIQHLYSFS